MGLKSLIAVAQGKMQRAYPLRISFLKIMRRL